MDIKDNETETPDTIARRIEQVVRILGPERIRWVHPDCGERFKPRPSEYADEPVVWAIDD